MLYSKRKGIAYLLPIAFILLISFTMYFKPVADLDELWNFNFARCIANGYEPYLDFNMVQTPLSAYISAFFLRIMGDSLFSFSGLSVALNFAVFCLLFIECEMVSKSTAISFVAVSFMQVICNTIWIYNYNNLNLLVELLILLLIIKSENCNKKNSLIISIAIGLLCGIALLVKQSTGLVIMLTNIIICIIKILCRRGKKINSLSQIFASFLPPSFFIIIIIANNHFSSFYNYAIAGIKNFTNHQSYISYLFSSPISFVVGLLPLAISIMLAYSIFKEKEKSKVSKETRISILLFSIAGCSAAVPICDDIHMLIAIVPFCICFFLSVRIKEMKSIENIACVLVAVAVSLTSAYLSFPLDGEYKKCDLNGYKGLFISSQLEQDIIKIDEYIVENENDGKSVVIADKDAVAFMIPINRYNKDYDMLLIGNTGNKTIEEILRQNNGMFMVKRNCDSMGYQSYIELIDYIKDNYKKIGEVTYYDVYEKAG